LLTSTSIRPRVCLTWSTIASTDSREVTSVRIPIAPLASKPAVATAVSSLTSVTTTVAPCEASFSAIALPIPWPAPVTIAILLSSDPISLQSVAWVSLVSRQKSGRERLSDPLAGDDQLHDLGGAVADLQAEHVA